MKIGIIDDGLDATHPFFDPTGLSYPPGFPKGQTQFTTPKVIVQRTFAPPSPPTGSTRRRPFDPSRTARSTPRTSPASRRATTTPRTATISLSGVAPSAYLGNYKALTIPTPGFGLDGNSAEIAAAIEAAVADGMNVINLSLGEPEVEPSRDIVVHAIEGAAQAGVVPVVAAGNDFDQFGYGSISSPANAPDAITVAATTDDRDDRRLLLGRPDPGLAAAQARRQRPGRRDHLVAARPTRAARAGELVGHEHGDARRSPAAPRC